MARTQTPGFSLVSQLAKGVRYFELQITFVQETPYFSKGGVVWETDVLSEMRQVGQFLEKRREFVIFRFSHFDTTRATDYLAPRMHERFGEDLVQAIGRHRIATRADNPVAQTFRYQCSERRRNVMILFDMPYGEDLHFVRNEIHISQRVLNSVYDPSVGTSSQLLNAMIDSTVKKFNTPDALSLFRNIHVHYRNIDNPNLSVVPPNNLGITLNVSRHANKNLGPNIVTYDEYTADLTNLIVLANKGRVKLLQKMGLL
jgi:hypothetical protein